MNLKRTINNKNGRPVPCLAAAPSCAARYYVYVDRIMLHEFGHTLGLHEFGHTLGLHDSYNDPTMDDLDAVMNTSYEIRDEDIEQLRAIYLLHTPH